VKRQQTGVCCRNRRRGRRNSKAHDQHRMLGEHLQCLFEFLAPYLSEPPILRIGGFPVGKADHGHTAAQNFPCVDQPAGPRTSSSGCGLTINSGPSGGIQSGTLASARCHALSSIPGREGLMMLRLMADMILFSAVCAIGVAIIAPESRRSPSVRQRECCQTIRTSSPSGLRAHIRKFLHRLMATSECGALLNGVYSRSRGANP